jgi:hypothetical protein
MLSVILLPARLLLFAASLKYLWAGWGTVILGSNPRRDLIPVCPVVGPTPKGVFRFPLLFAHRLKVP